MSIVYVSGPMTGYVNFNREAFARASAHLRQQGFIVVNPAEYDEGIEGWEHADFLRRDIRLLLDCDYIYLLPGWRYSKGATLEVDVADGTGIERLHERDLDLWRTFEGEPEVERRVCGGLFIPDIDLTRIKGTGA